MLSDVSTGRGLGRTQAVGSGFGEGRVVASLGGDFLLRQCESLTTRFLGAVAICTSSSSSLRTGAFFALLGVTGALSIDFVGTCEGRRSGFSSSGFVLGVDGSLGEDTDGRDAGAGAGAGAGADTAAGFWSPSDTDSTAFSAPASSSWTSACHFRILSRTLAGLLMPMALPKSAPFMGACLSGPALGFKGVASFFWRAEPRGLSGEGEAGIRTAGALGVSGGRGAVE